MTEQNTLPSLSDLHTEAQNESAPAECITIRISAMEFLPWSNSDNIVNKGVEVTASKMRFNLMIVLFVIGGPANVINMAVFAKQGLKDRVNLLLFSLSLADEIHLISSLLHSVELFYLQFTGDAHIGPMLAAIMNNNITMLQGMCFVSFALSSIIACERCYCVIRPLSYQTLMRTRTLAVIIIAVYVVLLSLMFLVAMRYSVGCVYDLDTGVKTSVYVNTPFYLKHQEMIDYIDSFVFGAGLPTAMVIVVVTATLITISRLRKAVAWRAESTAASLSAKEIALTKMLVGTSVLLIVCATPACLFRLASLFMPELKIGKRNENFFLTWLWITEMFVYINATFNIFIYFAMGSRYRETLRALFGRKRDRKTKSEGK